MGPQWRINMDYISTDFGVDCWSWLLEFRQTDRHTYIQTDNLTDTTNHSIHAKAITEAGKETFLYVCSTLSCLQFLRTNSGICFQNKQRRYVGIRVVKNNYFVIWVRSHISKTTRSLQPIFRVCSIWTWPGPTLVALWYITYFWFCVWHHFST